MAAVAAAGLDARRSYQQRVATLLEQVDAQRRRIYFLRAEGMRAVALRELKAELRELRAELASVTGG